ncbi:MAG: AAA family ATPase [Hyphomicrobiaceae bacterium]|nr:AAA family ATPase [Hyphomicrobiaceae bacterium]
MFADLSHSTRLSAEMEAEDYAELLDELRAKYDHVLERHGGMVFRVQGDGLLACFGYPNAREDDARRAVEAALELHQAVATRNPDGRRLCLHTGIHAGLVLLAPGDDVSGRLVLFGQAVNIAARLADVALDDEILASQDSLGAECHFFETDAGRVLSLPDIDKPIAVWSIRKKANVANRFEARSLRGLTPFVGRHDELRRLGSRMDAVVSGSAHYLAISAPPGQGKSRLADEFISRLDHDRIHVLRGYCESYLSAPPLQPFLQMLRSICRIEYSMSAADAREAVRRTLAQISPSLTHHAPSLFAALSYESSTEGEEGGGAQQASVASGAAFSALFDALALERPLLIFIDDWQWADDATRQLLAGIRGRIERSICVVVATRLVNFEGVELAGAERISLKPLRDEESDATIKTLLQSANTFEISQIREEAGGNPLFLEELCHSASQRMPRHQATGTSGASAWLSRLLAARVERLTTEHRDIVRTAAVIGNVIPARVLEIVSGASGLQATMCELSNLDVIHPAEQLGMYRFKHGIAREAIYETVGARERQILHLRIAEALEGLAALGQTELLHEQLAYHYAAAARWTEAAKYSERAGDKAIAASALDRAQAQYQAALDALGRTELTQENYVKWLMIARRLGLVCVFDPSAEHLDVLMRAIEVARRFNDENGLGHAEYWVGYVYYGLGDFKRATMHLEVALARAQRLGDASLMKWCGATLGQAYAAASQYDRALDLLGQAIDEKRRQKRMTRPAVGYAYSLACQASALGDRGEFDAAAECFREALQAVEGAGHEVEGSICCWQSGVQLWQGRWQDALDSSRRAQRVAERVKSLYLYAMSRSLGGYASWKLDGRSDALQTILESTAWLERAGKALFISLNYGWLAEILVANRLQHAGRQYAARALGRIRSHDRIGGAMAFRAMAQAAASGRYHKTSEHYLRLAAENAALRQSPHEIVGNAMCAAEILSNAGEVARAREHYEQALYLSNRLGMTWHAELASAHLNGHLRQIAGLPAPVAKPL